MRFLLILVAALTAAPGRAGPDFDHVNRLRARAGLGALVDEPRLAEAAVRHAAYLDRHRSPGDSAQVLSAHQELPGREGFSGELPADRVLAAAYPHRHVLENVSMGYRDAASATDALMSAIYHRLTFLDLAADQLGVAVGERSRVFVLGRSDISALCEAPPPVALFQAPLDCLGQPMRRDHYNALCADLPAGARFRQAHPVACPDGARLDADFMSEVCRQPPPAARFVGHGRYFLPCDNGLRVDADWFLGLCRGDVAGALLQSSGNYFEICEPPRRVQAEWFEAYCANLPDTARYDESMRFRRPCGHPHDIRVEYLDQLDAGRLDVVPELVLWPPDGAGDVPPAFFIEEPDPLPDRDVAGYPLSLQFNPQRVGEVEILRFALYRTRDGALEEVEATRLLSRESDPNGVLDGLQFALFPLDRLDWGAAYRAIVDARVDGLTRQIAWSFTTRGGGMPLLVANAGSQRFVVDNGLDYLLYLPPDGHNPYTVLSTRTEHLRANSVDMEMVDPNTLRVRIEARLCDRVRMRFDSGRSVELVPRGCKG